MKRLLTSRSCFYDRVSARAAENRDRTEKIQTPKDLLGGGAFSGISLEKR